MGAIKEANIIQLAQQLAHTECFEADCGGYGFDTENPEDVDHFLPGALRRAREYARILEGEAEVTTYGRDQQSG